MAHNIFHWSTMTNDRKSAALGFYVWGMIGALVFCFSSVGVNSWFGWMFTVISITSLLLAVFASETLLKNSLGLLNIPWPF